MHLTLSLALAETKLKYACKGILRASLEACYGRGKTEAILAGVKSAGASCLIRVLFMGLGFRVYRVYRV